MPVVPGGDLALLRSAPQTSRLFMVIQQPARYNSDDDEFTVADFVWHGTVRVAPGATDPILSLEITSAAASSGVTLLDGMSIYISSSAYGKQDRAAVSIHGDQTVVGGGANETLHIAVASGLPDVQVGDFVVVLDEFRFRTLYPKITESAGALSWFKYYGYFLDSIGEAGGDIGYTWAQLGAADANRRGASSPPVPIMSSHVVQFIDPDVGSVDINFDWSDSYALAPGAAVDAWAAVGENDHVGGSWNSAAQNPVAQTYSVLSGLRGFRTTLELGTDGDDPILEFRRGVRYVFTLRHPDKLQAGDPSDAAPITDFMIGTMSGSFDQGGWTTTVTVFENQASEYQITPGALVIIFSEDTFGSTKTSIGPDDSNLTDRKNILMIGHITNDSIRKEPETGDVTFDVASVSELMKNRENYPVPIENDGAADEWYKTPTLTVDRAAHHYLRWHTNLCLIADLYQTGDTREVSAMDFLAGDAYSTVDTFIQDRLFARLLCDRFGRFSMEIDVQIEAAGGAATLFALADTDWLEEVGLREVNEPPVSIADLGGLFYNAGLSRPYLSHAPGDVSGYVGTPESRTSLALASQAQLNTICGNFLAYRNNRWPELSATYAGNWRVFDIWPQEYVSVSLVTERHTFSSDLFIVRRVELSYDAAIGVISTTVSHEFETDGPDGITIVIPTVLPEKPNTTTTTPPSVPPSPSMGFLDTGRRVLSSNEGVFVTNDIALSSPRWYKIDAGLPSSGAERCWYLRRDPWHWSEGDKRLWGVFGPDGQDHRGDLLYAMDDFPYGTWSLSFTATPDIKNAQLIKDLKASYETLDLWYLVRFQWQSGARDGNLYIHRSVDGGDNWVQLNDLGTVDIWAWWATTWLSLAIAQHSGAQQQHLCGTNIAPITGGAWTGSEWAAFTIDTDYPRPGGQLYIPYGVGTDSYLVALVYSGAVNTYVSENLGVDWNPISPTGFTMGNARAWQNDLGYICGLTTTGRVMYTTDNGETWTTLRDTGVGGFSLCAPVVDWTADGRPARVLHYRESVPAGLYEITSLATVNKTGNLLSIAPGITEVTSIQRDAIGISDDI